MQWKDHDGAPDEGTELCTLDEVEDEVGKELVIGDRDTKWPFRMFVVRRGGRVWGYVNTCLYVIKIRLRVHSETYVPAHPV